MLVGQAPSRTSDPARPLSGEPLSTKLAALCGLTVPEYLEAFDRRNLLPLWPGKNGKGDLFPIRAARAAAADMSVLLVDRDVVFLGRNVARAFGRPGLPFLAWHAGIGGPPGRAACLPHPSGVNLWWNDERNRRAAARFLRRLLRPPA